MKSQLKKFISIYLAAVGGIVGVILAVAVIVEVVDRLKVDNQILLQLESEEADEKAPRILKIGAWTKVDDKSGLSEVDDALALGDEFDRYSQNYFATTGKLFIFPAEKYAFCELTDNADITVGGLKTVTGHSYLINKQVVNCRSYSVIRPVFEECTLTASADAELEVVLTLRNNEIFYGKPPSDFTVDGLESTYDGDIKGRDELAVNFRVLKHGLDSGALKKRAEIRDEDGSYEQLHYASYYQNLSEIRPGLAGQYATVDRDVTEFEVVFSAYDRSNPDKLIARARVLITSYGKWDFTSALGTDYTYTEELLSLGINTPENYGYTTATLYDYWQIEEW